MLATAQAAYKEALGAQFAQINGRRWQAQEIDKLRGEVAHWQAAVDRETAIANGTASRGRGGVFRFTL